MITNVVQTFMNTRCMLASELDHVGRIPDDVVLADTLEPE